MGFFILDNALNNNIILIKLGKTMGFKPIQKQLYYIGYIINLIAELYIFRQNMSIFKENYIKVLPGERRKLWRQRRELEKLHNLVIYIIASGKRTDLFLIL